MRPLYTGFFVLALFFLCRYPAHAALVVPTVVTASTVPSSSTNIALNTTVSVTFSTVMTTTSITKSSFYILDSTGTQVATNNPTASTDKKTFTLTPTSNLSSCTTYTIIVTTSVQSSSSPKGNLASQYSKSFQTVVDSVAPTVTSQVPVAGASGVIEFSPVTVTFSKMMDRPL